MTDTIREQIISKVIDRLGAIKIVDDFDTDIGKRVYRVQRGLLIEDLPACNVWPGVEESERRYGKNHCTMPIRIEGFVDINDHDYLGFTYLGETNPSIISESILGDLIKCMTDQTYLNTWTAGLTDDVFYSGGGTETYPDQGNDIVGAFINLTIAYRYLIGNPYSQS